jgi:hypothetical protein
LTVELTFTKFANFAGLYFPHFTTFRGDVVMDFVLQFLVLPRSKFRPLLESSIDTTLARQISVKIDAYTPTFYRMQR